MNWNEIKHWDKVTITSFWKEEQYTFVDYDKRTLTK